MCAGPRAPTSRSAVPPPLLSLPSSLTLRLQFGTDPQEARAIAAPGQPAKDPAFGLEDESIWGTLSTTTAFDEEHQALDEASGLWVSKYPSLPGWYRGYYDNVAAAVRGEAEVFVRPETSRDGLRVIELARRSHEEGRTVAWEW